MRPTTKAKASIALAFAMLSPNVTNANETATQPQPDLFNQICERTANVAAIHSQRDQVGLSTGFICSLREHTQTPSNAIANIMYHCYLESLSEVTSGSNPETGSLARAHDCYKTGAYFIAARLDDHQNPNQTRIEFITQLADEYTKQDNIPHQPEGTFPPAHFDMSLSPIQLLDLCDQTLIKVSSAHSDLRLAALAITGCTHLILQDYPNNPKIQQAYDCTRRHLQGDAAKLSRTKLYACIYYAKN